VQHDTFAAVNYNFVYDILGAGIVAEDGNEIGEWIGNFVTGIRGDNESHSVDRDEREGDFGHAGDAYNSQTRNMLFQDNIAANAKQAWVFRNVHSRTTVSDKIPDRTPAQLAQMLEQVTTFPPDPRMIQFNPDPMRVPGADNANFVGFNDNEAIATAKTFDTGHRHRQGYSAGIDLKHEINRFVAWRGGTFDTFNYSFNYIFVDSLFIGSDNDTDAFRTLTKTNGNVFVRNHFENYRISALRLSGINSDSLVYDSTWVNTPSLFPDGNTHPEGVPVYNKNDITPIGELEIEYGKAPPSLTSKGRQLDLTLGKNDTKFHVLARVRDSFGWQYLYNAYWIGSGKDKVYQTKTDSAYNLQGDDKYSGAVTSAYPSDLPGNLDSKFEPIF